MKEIELSFDIASQNLGYDEITNLGRSISQKLDSAFSDIGVGRLGGATYSPKKIDIRIFSKYPDLVISAIKINLAGTKLLPMMKIKQEA